MQGLAVAYEDRCVRFASHEGTLIGVWRDPPNRPRASAVRALQRRLMVGRPGIQALHVVVAGETSPLTLPDVDRNEMAEIVRALKGTQSTSAIAFEGSAFFVAAWRSIFSAVLLLLRPDYPLRVFSKREEAIAWLERVGADRPGARTAADLTALVAEVERGLSPP